MTPTGEGPSSTGSYVDMISDGKENGGLESFFSHPGAAEGSWVWGTLVVTNSCWESHGHSEEAE